MRGKGFPAKAATHLVQFYGDDQVSLVRNVSSFVREGLEAGGSSIVIASRERRDAIASELPGAAVTYADAREMLASFMVGGRPHPALFDASVGKMVRAHSQRGPLRAYGEMVGYLWTAGQREAAIELEELWNALLGRVRFSLFCGYPIGPDQSTDELVAAHTECIGPLGSTRAFTARIPSVRDRGTRHARKSTVPPRSG